MPSPKKECCGVSGSGARVFVREVGAAEPGPEGRGRVPRPGPGGRTGQSPWPGSP